MIGYCEVAGSAAPPVHKMVAASGMMRGKNRRAAQRFPAKPGTTVSYVEGAAAVRDLSMDGMFLLDAEPLPVGTKITFSLMLGHEPGSFQGIVRRSVAGEGMGIQFTETPRELRRRLLSHNATIL
jgi:hypothetical protein